MKIAKTIILAGSMLAACVTGAQADVTVYITGATAYRAAAVQEIKNFLNGGFVGIYGTKSGVTSELNAANVAFRGTTNLTSGLGVITFKAAWGGSVGGIKLIQSTTTFNVDDQPGVNGWIPDSALPPGNTGGTIFPGAENNTVTPPTIAQFSGGTVPFERGNSAAQPDAAFSDAFQTSALNGVTGDAVPSRQSDTSNLGIIGVIPFDLVVCNGVTAASVTKFTGVTYVANSPTVNYTGTSGATVTDGRTIGGLGIPKGTTIQSHTTTTLTLSANTTSANNDSPNATTISAADTVVAPFDNINANQLNAILSSGGRLPMLTGSSSDSGVGVFLYGRNADSGTRISQLGESGRGIFNRPSFHVIPTFNPAGLGSGKGGNPGNLVAALAKWPQETVLGVTYTLGQGGYTSGGDLADALTSPGSTAATVSSGVPRAGWVIGYLGRSDASRACATTFGQNTAKRLTFNGQQDWSGLGTANKVDGTPVGGFVDDAVREGNYQGWEFEHFFRRSDLDGTSEATVLDSLATNIINAAAVSGTIKLSTIHVTKSIEGGAVTYP